MRERLTAAEAAEKEWVEREKDWAEREAAMQHQIEELFVKLSRRQQQEGNASGELSTLSEQNKRLLARVAELERQEAGGTADGGQDRPYEQKIKLLEQERDAERRGREETAAALKQANERAETAERKLQAFKQVTETMLADMRSKLTGFPATTNAEKVEETAVLREVAAKTIAGEGKEATPIPKAEASPVRFFR
jgi:chromosome segregation ATPase